jgi:hypothetical protein
MKTRTTAEQREEMHSRAVSASGTHTLISVSVDQAINLIHDASLAEQAIKRAERAEARQCGRCAELDASIASVNSEIDRAGGLQEFAESHSGKLRDRAERAESALREIDEALWEKPIDAVLKISASLRRWKDASK